MMEREYPRFVFASFGSRAIGFLIDLLAIKFLISIIGQPIFHLLSLERTGQFFTGYNLIGLAIYLAYFFLMTYLNQGQTLGKMIMGTRVISLYEKDLSLDVVFYREIVGRFILKKLGIFYLMMLFNRDRQDLADFFAGTSVVENEYFDEYMELRKQSASYSGEEILISREDDQDE